jgi:outer membrane protein assembly factor BamB
LNRLFVQRRLILLAVLAVLLLGASGCGAARATSWTGLTVAGERVYAADLLQVVALNASGSDSIWVFPEDTKNDNRGFFYVAPAVDEERVIVASYIPPRGFLSQARNVVWALDAETGEELWHFDDAAGQYVEGGAVSNGIFVIGNSDGNVYALDVESGGLKWSFPTGHRVWATPLIMSDTVCIGSMDHHLYALNLSDGSVRWDFHAEGAFAGTPALQDGTLYIGAFDNRLYAVDENSGTERWQFPGENWFWGSPAVHGDIVYAVDVKGNVYALDADTKEQIWHEALEVPVRAGVVLAEDRSRVFVGSQNGALYTLDAATGDRLWSIESEGQILSAPVVSGSVIHLALINGPHRVRALHVDNGREMWSYPQEEE